MKYVPVLHQLRLHYPDTGWSPWNDLLGMPLKFWEDKIAKNPGKYELRTLYERIEE